MPQLRLGWKSIQKSSNHKPDSLTFPNLGKLVMSLSVDKQETYLGIGFFV